MNVGMSFADYFKNMPDEPEKKNKRSRGGRGGRGRGGHSEAPPVVRQGSSNGDPWSQTVVETNPSPWDATPA